MGLNGRVIKYIVKDRRSQLFRADGRGIAVKIALSFNHEFAKPFSISLLESLGGLLDIQLIDRPQELLDILFHFIFGYRVTTVQSIENLKRIFLSLQID